MRKLSNRREIVYCFNHNPSLPLGLSSDNDVYSHPMITFYARSKHPIFKGYLGGDYYENNILTIEFQTNGDKRFNWYGIKLINGCLNSPDSSIDMLKILKSWMKAEDLFIRSENFTGTGNPSLKKRFIRFLKNYDRIILDKSINSVKFIKYKEYRKRLKINEKEITKFSPSKTTLVVSNVTT